MKKCMICGATKNLKSVWSEEDDGTKSRACCKRCFKDNEFEDEGELWIFWDWLNYRWEPKEKEDGVLVLIYGEIP